MRLLVAWIILLITSTAFGQTKSASIKGTVIDENDRIISNASIVVLGRTTGIIASDSGTFHIKVPAEKAFALVISHTGFKPVQKNFFLSHNESETIIIKLFREGTLLQGVVVTDERERTENSLVKINPKNAYPFPGFLCG